MIILNLTPKSRTNDPFFRFEYPFMGDISKTYSCQTIGSNLPSPKFIGFNTKTVNGITGNYIELEFEARCNQTQITVELSTQAEIVNKVKFEFLKWFASFFTWFDFLFRWFSLKTLKKVTLIIFGAIASVMIAGALYAFADIGYNYLTGESLDDTEIIQQIDDFRFRNIGNYFSEWFREDAKDDFEDLGVFIKEKAGDVKEKAADLKDAAKDKYEDITD